MAATLTLAPLDTPSSATVNSTPQPGPSTQQQPVLGSVSEAPAASISEASAPSELSPTPLLNPDLPVCANCKTQTTPLWRRAENGTTLCNACSLYQKMKGTPRPVSLKTDVIKHRNRSKGENARKSTKAAMAAAAANSAYGDEYTGRSHSRGASHSRTRDGLGQKSGPGGADEADAGEYWDDDGTDYKRARHGVAYGAGFSHSPSRQARGSSRGRGSRSSSQQRRSDSSESRSGYTPDGAPANGMMPPHLIPYPIFYYPPGAATGNGQPFAYPYPAAMPPPPPEWAAYMQQMQSQGMAPPGFMPHYMMGPQPGMIPGHAPNGSPDPNTLAAFRVQQPHPHAGRSQSLDSSARDVERGRSPMVLPLVQSSMQAPDLSRSLGGATAAQPAYFHPYQRASSMHTRPTAAISDARLTSPREARARRSSDAQRPTSSASTSSGGSQEGLFATSPAIGSAVASRAPDAMTIDEVDESPDLDADGEADLEAPSQAGPIRGGPAYERRGRSSTRKPANNVGYDVDERLEKMRMESPPLNATPMPSLDGVIGSQAGLPPTAAAAPVNRGTGSADEPADEMTILRLRVAELEFINGILQTRIGELEKQSTSVKPV